MTRAASTAVSMGCPSRSRSCSRTDPPTDALREAAHRRAEVRFGWESIVRDYERWFSQRSTAKAAPSG